MIPPPGSPSHAGSGAEAFRDDAVATNRSGHLTAAQRRELRGQAHRFRRSELSFAVVLIVIGALVAFAAGPSKDAAAKPIVGAAFGVVALVLIARSFIGADALSADLRAGRVDMVHGSSFKRVATGAYDGAANTPPEYFIHVVNSTDGEQRFKAPSAVYEFADDAGYVDLFYLPRTRRVVNLVRLPDPPLGALTYDTARDATRSLLAARRSKDPVQSAQAGALAAALRREIGAQAWRAQAPPGPAADPRELSSALVGTWHNVFATVTFSADGSLIARLGPGLDQPGTWSVDAGGLLHTDALGEPLKALATVHGSVLTLFAEGRAVKLSRVS